MAGRGSMRLLCSHLKNKSSDRSFLSTAGSEIPLLPTSPSSPPHPDLYSRFSISLSASHLTRQGPPHLVLTRSQVCVFPLPPIPTPTSPQFQELHKPITKNRACWQQTAHGFCPALRPWAAFRKSPCWFSHKHCPAFHKHHCGRP